VCFALQKVQYRRVLEDDGRGRQKVEVEQVAAWKLLMFSGSFTTRLYVFQDKRRGVVSTHPWTPISSGSHVQYCLPSDTMSQLY